MPTPRPEPIQQMPDDAKKVFSGKVFDVYQWQQELYDGTTATFEKLKRPDTVVVFPVLPDGKILLTEQIQPGKKPFLAATGGRVEEGEDALEAAKRELHEEVGYEADAFVLWDARQITSKMDYAVFTFIAKGARKVAEAHVDAGEKIQLKPVSFDEFVEIASQKDFYEPEMSYEFLEAKYNPTKKEELRKLFEPQK